MSGTFRGTFNTGNDSDRISEELFDAFNMDDYNEDRTSRSRARSNARPVKSSGKSSGRRPAPTGRKKKRKDRQLIAMIGLSVLAFILIVEILLGIFLLKVPAIATISILLMNLAIGIILGPCFILAPILIVVVEIAAGIFAGQWILAFMGALLLMGAQVMCFLLK